LLNSFLLEGLFPCFYYPFVYLCVISGIAVISPDNLVKINQQDYFFYASKSVPATSGHIKIKILMIMGPSGFSVGFFIGSDRLWA